MFVVRAVCVCVSERVSEGERGGKRESIVCVCVCVNVCGEK